MERSVQCLEPGAHTFWSENKAKKPWQPWQ